MKRTTQDNNTEKVGSVDASFDYNNNRGYDSSCPSGHSDNFCAGYSDG